MQISLYNYSLTALVTANPFLDATFSGSKSLAYDHFNISLERTCDDTGGSKEITFVFECKTDPKQHKSHRRPRMNTGAGTSNLLAGIRACDKRHGIDSLSALSTAKPGKVVNITYSEAAHRALIALRCARNQRPFNIVNDPLYEAEVRMLRPGTTLPSAETVSRDTQLLYHEISRSVKDHFLAFIHSIE